MYIIYNAQTNLYVHVGGKLIIFSSIQEAQEFLQNFFQFAMAQPPIGMDLFEVHNRLSFLQSCTIEPFLNNFTCETITWQQYKDLKEKANEY